MKDLVSVRREIKINPSCFKVLEIVKLSSPETYGEFGLDFGFILRVEKMTGRSNRGVDFIENKTRAHNTSVPT